MQSTNFASVAVGICLHEFAIGKAKILLKVFGITKSWAMLD